MNSFQNYWIEILLTNKPKSFKTNIKPQNSCNDISCRCDVIITRLRNGHSLLTHSYFLAKKKTLPLCELCDSEISVSHILFQGPKYQHERSLFLTPNITEEIFEDDPQKIRKLLNFFSSTKLLSLI